MYLIVLCSTGVKKTAAEVAYGVDSTCMIRDIQIVSYLQLAHDYCIFKLSCSVHDYCVYD